MTPVLVAVSGPRQGCTFRVEGRELYVGREPGSGVCLPDPLVSRRHAVIWSDEQGILLIDLRSQNGTFVNDVPVNTKVLLHGDRITIGGSSFVFLARAEEEVAPGRTVRITEGDARMVASARLPVAQSVYLREDRARAPLPPRPRTVRDLDVLLGVGARIGRIRDLDELQRAVLGTLGGVLPVARSAILLGEPGADDLAATSTWRRGGSGDGEMRIDRGIVRQAVDGRAAILGGVGADGRAVRRHRPGTVLCAPLVGLSRVLGAVYLDAVDPATPFDESDLQLVTAVAGLVGVAVDNIRRMELLEGETRRLQEDCRIEHQLVGDSPAMREVLHFLAKVAPTGATVLLCGESGTGKELAARAVHAMSRRATGPFVAINCAALTEPLFESELFGHERGAFTGAIAQKKGRIELARGGTLFLDEVGEIPLCVQAKLLRFLQEREFERVGGTRTLITDARILAATNQDLEHAVKAGRFRKDLFYRLNVVSVTIPPLRERREDVKLLANFFVTKLAANAKRKVAGISSEAMAYLMSYGWPGNVRELENAVERAVVLGTAEVVLPEDLPAELLERAPAGAAAAPRFHEAIRKAKRMLILDAIRQASGSYKDAAAILGVHPNYLHRLIRNLNLRPALRNQTQQDLR